MKNEIRVVIYDPKDFCRLPDNDVIWLRFNVPDGIVDVEARRRESTEISNLRRRVVQGHILEWPFTLLKKGPWEAHIKKVMPLFERIRAGYAVDDKGGAMYSVDAMMALHEFARIPIAMSDTVAFVQAMDHFGPVDRSLMLADYFSGMSTESIIAKYDNDPDVSVDGMDCLMNDMLLVVPIGHRDSIGAYCHFCAEFMGVREDEDAKSVFADYRDYECTECGCTLGARMIQRAKGIRKLMDEGRTRADIMTMSEHDIVAAVVPEMREECS